MLLSFAHVTKWDNGMKILSVLFPLIFAASISQISLDYHMADVKKLLDANICRKCDLSGMNLSGEKLNGVEMHKGNLKGVNLRGAELRGNIKESRFK